jgi:hypothetical protein
VTADKVIQIAEGQDQTESEGKRGKSTIEFPYLDMDDAIELASGVHQCGGSSCQWDQLAAQLKASATGGGFRLRLITAKTFGLLTYERGSVTLTPLGMRMVDAQQERSARTEAFLTVPLYRALYEKFRGVSLPPTAGLEREIESLGVAPKQKEKARQVFQRSAKQAGFFEFGSDRLVPPAGSKIQQKDNGKDREQGAKPPHNPPPAYGGGGSGDYHPFIQGLLKSLPAPDADWSIEQRVRWLQTAAGIFDLMYKGNEDSRQITVKAESSLS